MENHIYIKLQCQRKRWIRKATPDISLIHNATVNDACLYFVTCTGLTAIIILFNIIEGPWASEQTATQLEKSARTLLLLRTSCSAFWRILHHLSKILLQIFAFSKLLFMRTIETLKKRGRLRQLEAVGFLQGYCSGKYQQIRCLQAWPNKKEIVCGINDKSRNFKSPQVL